MPKNDSQKSIDYGYRQALNLAREHYENFPVISFLVPSALRKHIAIVYWFARTADDFSDEGNFTDSERLVKLEKFEMRLHSLLNNQPENNIESALKNTINSKKLTPENFFNLLRAFKQDVVKKRYSNFHQVLDYCSNSANPIGRIVLELFDVRSEKANFYSDKICTALQITNFIQDTKIDYKRGRIYYPVSDMKQFEVKEEMFELSRINTNFKKLIEFSVNRVQDYFDEGRILLEFLSGRLKYEIAWTISGGEEVLRKIRGADFDILCERPYLSKVDYIKLLIKSLMLK
jgi:squalene synthase HpnC